MDPLHPDTLLGYVPFAVFSEARREILLRHCRRHYVRKGQSLLAPGIPQTHASFLMAGQATLASTGEIVTAAFAHALHHVCNKHDTLTALTDCSLFQIERDLLDRFVCWTQVSSYLGLDFASQRQYDADAAWMCALLQSNLFYKVSPLNLQKIFSCMTPLPVRQGQVILKQGETGDCCYFIKEGLAKVTRLTEPETKPAFLAEVGIAGCVGEDALLHETVRNATVTMASDGVLMKMEKRDFLQLLREPAVDVLPSSDIDLALQADTVFLDVRTTEEYQHAHLAGARSFPLDLLRLQCRLLDPGKPYVVCCDTDRRSKAAVYLLGQQGIRARALAGGLNAMPWEFRQLSPREPVKPP